MAPVPSATSEARELLQQWHGRDTRRRYVHLLWTILHAGLMIASVLTWSAGYWPVTVALWGLCAHVGHSKLVAFHEASHGTLDPTSRVNDFQGMVLGTTILVPLSAYRFVHARHHAHLGTERDLELWPFVNTRVPRWQRILAAIGELGFGFFYTPIVFLHGVLSAPRIPRQHLRRIMLEYALAIGVWTIVLTVVQVMRWWEPFLVGYVAHALIAGNLQSIRKFTEHMGLFGGTILTSTRTVVDSSAYGETMSKSMLRVEYHGTHHLHARVPYYHLPAATPHVYDGRIAAVPIYRSYAAAMWDMVRTLGNPRIGAQWLDASTQREW